MWRAKLARLIVAFAVTAPLLAACSDFDADKLDFFHLSEKKKLPGERKPLFPEGVPGVSNGVPPDLVKGYQPPAQAADAVPAEQDKPATAEKPKLKPRVAKQAIPVPPATRITVQPAQKNPGDQPPAQQQQQQQQQQQPEQAQAPWPAAQPAQQAQPNGAQSPWPSTSQQSSPWPAPPASGTFQR